MLFRNYNWGVNRFTDKILEPYVGLRPDLLPSRNIMTLHCYVDDSGSEPQSKYYVLAGYIAKVGEWRNFTEQWNERLLSSGLAYFKMSEAMNWSGEFSEENGWNAESIEKEVDHFSKIIFDNCASSVSCRIQHSHFRQYVNSIPSRIPKNNRAKTPYYLLFCSIISRYWMRCEQLNIKERCEFIFDNQHGYEHKAKELFPMILDGNKLMFPRSHRSYIGSTPAFEDDKEYLPIQAADMMAWLLRRFKSVGDVGKMSEIAKRNLISIPHHAFDFPESHLEEANKKVSGMVDSLKALNPNSKWH